MTAVILTWASLAVVFALVILNAAMTRRSYKLMKHAHALDQLLAQICVQAYANRHKPIWAAWTATMGDISIEVTQTRRHPKAD